MIVVEPEHPIANEAYETVKALKCEYIQIQAKTYQKTPSELGYFITGIFPSNSEEGMNRSDWMKRFEKLQEV